MCHFQWFSTALDIVITYIWPTIQHGIYYSDYTSDILLAHELTKYCHYKYFTMCVLIMIMTHLTTVLYLKLTGNSSSWKTAFGYPWYHAKDIYYLALRKPSGRVE